MRLSKVNFVPLQRQDDKSRMMSLERRGSAPDTRDIAVSKSSQRSFTVKMEGTGSQYSEPYPTYRYISYYDLCFPSFRCHSMEHSEHGLTQHSLLKATQLPGMLFLSERGVKKYFFFRMSLMSLLCSSIHTIRLPVIACRYH